MFKAVIFDFDGVISDTEILHFEAFNTVLKAFGVEIGKADYYDKYLGLTDMDCFAELIREGILDKPGVELESLVRGKNIIFEETAKTKAGIIDGVRDFIAMLKENNVPMAIFSGALLAEIELILDFSNLREFFEVIISAEQVTHAKPSPEGFLLAIEKLNGNRKVAIEANECVVIEDSRWGLEAARSARMHSIGVTNSYEAEQLSVADKIVANLGELTIKDLEQLCSTV